MLEKLMIAVLVISAVALVLGVVTLVLCLRRKRALEVRTLSNEDAVRDLVALKMTEIKANIEGLVQTTTASATTALAQSEALRASLSTTLDGMNHRLDEGLRQGRIELAASVEALRQSMDVRAQQTAAGTDQRLVEMRAEVARQMAELRAENQQQLTEMRNAMDRQLGENLDGRLSRSFSMINEGLQSMSKELVAMQSLSQGMNDLRRVLTGVKTRGTWGELSLQSLLEEIFTPDQYIVNFHAGRSERSVVEFAVKLPGKKEGEEVYLPIDSKFPLEDYARLVEASQQGNKEEVEVALKALSVRVKSEARDIHDKYIKPPKTTEFAILYLPIEGLFAEVTRQVQLLEEIRRNYQVVVAGPTTLTALLNSLQVGFRTMAIEKRSKEVWRLLDSFRRTFETFAGNIIKAESQLETAAKTLRKTGEQTERIKRQLSAVEQLQGFVEEAAATSEEEDE